jgi:hypothetical protein
VGSESENKGLVSAVLRVEIIVGWCLGFCLTRQPSITPIVCCRQSKQLLDTRKSFKSITLTKGIYDAFSKKNQTSCGDWVHPTLASRNSDSDFAPDLSAAGLYVRALRGEVACAKTRVTSTILNPHT